MWGSLCIYSNDILMSRVTLERSTKVLVCFQSFFHCHEELNLNGHCKCYNCVNLMFIKLNSWSSFSPRPHWIYKYFTLLCISTICAAFCVLLYNLSIKSDYNRMRQIFIQTLLNFFSLHANHPISLFILFYFILFSLLFNFVSQNVRTVCTKGSWLLLLSKKKVLMYIFI